MNREVTKANLENLEKQSGIESSLTDDDIKQYLEVFSEIKVKDCSNQCVNKA